MIDIKAKIISNKKIAKDFYKIIFKAPKIVKGAQPGQFVMVKCSNATNPLLRRPFSFHRINKTSFELLYKTVGKGTKILSKRKKGEVLDVLGPLGNGFNIGVKAVGQGSYILVGGGTGIAPLLELARKLTTYSLQLIAYMGARTKSHVVCKKELERLGVKVNVATEDGSLGHKGLVTDLLIQECEPKPGKKTPKITIYACGPKPMLKAISEIAALKKIPCQVSLEERMGCGTGACLGCAVKTKKGYRKACKDGPVFNAGEIIW